MGPTNRQAVFAGVLLLANRMQTTFDGELPDLTLKQWLALTVIAHLPQPVASTAVVADALGTTHQNVSKLVAALDRQHTAAAHPAAALVAAGQPRRTAAGQPGGQCLAAPAGQGEDPPPTGQRRAPEHHSRHRRSLHLHQGSPGALPVRQPQDRRTLRHAAGDDPRPG